MYYCFSPYFCPPHTRNVSLHIPPAEGSRILECEEAPSDSRLQQLLTYADGVANWISAEVVSCDSVKVRGHATHQRRRGPPGGGGAKAAITASALIPHRQTHALSHRRCPQGPSAASPVSWSIDRRVKPERCLSNS